MSAASERRARMERVRRLLEVQGDDENLSRLMETGESHFRVDCPLPADLRQRIVEEYGEAEARDAEHWLSVKFDWFPALLFLQQIYNPQALGQMLAIATVAADLNMPDGYVRDQIAEMTAEQIRRREPRALRCHAAMQHIAVFAPEVFEAVSRLLFASARAWVAAEVDDDRPAAESIIKEAIKEIERIAYDRVGLKLKGRPHAFTKMQLRRALFSLYEEDTPRPYTQTATVERLRAFEVFVTERTLSTYAARSVYGDWESLAEAYAKEFDHWMTVRAEDLIGLVDETERGES